MKITKGFTLLETLISMAVILIAIGVVFYAFSMSLRLFVDESKRTDVYIEADRGMNIMTKELRGAKEIISAASNEVTFWLFDRNGNGTKEADEVVTFTWSGVPNTSINRIASNETIHIAYKVKNLLFIYDDPANVKLINIVLTVGNEITATLESSIKPRNL